MIIIAIISQVHVAELLQAHWHRSKGWIESSSNPFIVPMLLTWFNYLYLCFHQSSFTSIPHLSATYLKECTRPGWQCPWPGRRVRRLWAEDCRGILPPFHFPWWTAFGLFHANVATIFDPNLRQVGLSCSSEGLDRTATLPSTSPGLPSCQELGFVRQD